MVGNYPTLREEPVDDNGRAYPSYYALCVKKCVVISNMISHCCC